MTVAAGKTELSDTNERPQGIESQAAELALAARQLGLTKNQVARLLDRLWEEDQ